MIFNVRKAMRTWFAAAGLALMLLAAGCASGDGEPETFDGQRAYELVRQQMAFGPRYPGSEGHQAVGDWIVAQLESAGWEVEQQRFDYRGVGLRNIIAFRSGAEGQRILLGAHYDTRRLADRDPQDRQGPVPGANDGASGVAVLLELARVLPQGGAGDDVALVFFDGEDQGGLEGWEWIAGSTYYAASMGQPPAAVVIVDMVGDATLDIYYERNSEVGLMEEIWSIAAQLGYAGFKPQARYAVLDDHIPFVRQGIPAVDLIDLDYPYWHTRADTADKLSAASLAQVGETLYAWLVGRMAGGE